MNLISELLVSVAYFGLGFFIGALYVSFKDIKKKENDQVGRTPLLNTQRDDELNQDHIRRKLLKSINELSIDNFTPTRNKRER
jgi:hypothetical protein